MYLKINGLNLHVEDRGNSDGLPLVLLHSWAGSSRPWKYVVAALPNRLRPITLDQRGWGRSESHSSGFQLADLASDAKEVVKALKLDRYVLVGHSMGGKVAQLIASERPEKLSGLILVAPAMPGPMHRPPEVREGMVGVMNSAALIQQTDRQYAYGQTPKCRSSRPNPSSNFGHRGRTRQGRFSLRIAVGASASHSPCGNENHSCDWAPVSTRVADRACGDNQPFFGRTRTR